MWVTHQYLVSPTKSMALVLDIIFPGILWPRVELHSGAQLVGSVSSPPEMLFAHGSIALKAKKADQATQCSPAETSAHPKAETQQRLRGP